MTAKKTIVVDGDDKKDDNGRVGIIAGVALLMLLFGLAIGAGFGKWLWDESEVNNKLTNDLAVANTKVADLQRQAEESAKRQGLTADACTKMGQDIVAKSCIGKTETVTKTITKYRDRPTQLLAPTWPPVSTNSGYERRGQPLDRCVFRIKGEIKAETFVENGEVNCPAWRDKQLSLFNKNPRDMIWDRKYPTAKPM